MAKGRKRKAGRREPNGRIQRPADYTNHIALENQSVAINARQRHHKLTAEQARMALAGYPMGVLHLRKIITARQLEAANRQVLDYLKLHRLKGWPSPHPKCAAYSDAIAGGAGGYEPDAQTVKAAMDRWNESISAIIASLGALPAINAVHSLRMFALHQVDPDLCTPSRAAPLVEGCNALAEFYGV